MPVYEYACRACGHRFEERQGTLEAPLTTCPECSGPLRRVYGPVSFVLRGGGWAGKGG